VIAALGAATIVGPGEVDTNTGGCVGGPSRLTVDGGTTGIDIHGCLDGVVGSKTVQIANATVHDNTEIGVFGARVNVTNVTSNGNSHGFIADLFFKGTGVTASGNVHSGVIADKAVQLQNATLDGNGANAVWTEGLALLTNTTVSNSGEIGVLAKTIRLHGSSVTGSGVQDSFPPNIDLIAPHKPKLIGSTCGKSWGGPTGTWGVCVND
jgi:hypothetical protein